MPFTPPVIAEFNQADDIEAWNVVDDVVMGGRSDGHFHYNSDGYAIFTGNVSLANNGGFSSVQYDFETQELKKYRSIIIRLKGDGKSYQFRVKSENNQQHWYVHEFETSGQWQEVELRMNDFAPRYRGDDLDIPDYRGDQLSAVAFLIANGAEQDFTLKIDKISLK